MPSPQSIAMDIANAVPGCRAERFALEGNTVLSGQVMGWGPTLHRTGMAWAATPQDMTKAAIEAALTPYVDRQRARIAAADALGLSTLTQPAGSDIRHILVDRVLLEHDRDMVTRAIRDTVGKLPLLSMSGRDTSLPRFGVVFSDGTPEDPHPTATLEYVVDEMVYDGTFLHLRQAVPETIAEELAGRTVGEVVMAETVSSSQVARLLERIADRVVTSSRNQGGGLRLEFDADWTPAA